MEIAFDSIVDLVSDAGLAPHRMDVERLLRRADENIARSEPRKNENFERMLRNAPDGEAALRRYRQQQERRADFDLRNHRLTLRFQLARALLEAGFEDRARTRLVQLDEDVGGLLEDPANAEFGVNIPMGAPDLGIDVAIALSRVGETDRALNAIQRYPSRRVTARLVLGAGAQAHAYAEVAADLAIAGNIGRAIDVLARAFASLRVTDRDLDYESASVTRAAIRGGFLDEITEELAAHGEQYGEDAGDTAQAAREIVFANALAGDWNAVDDAQGRLQVSGNGLPHEGLARLYEALARLALADGEFDRARQYVAPVMDSSFPPVHLLARIEAASGDLEAAVKIAAENAEALETIVRTADADRYRDIARLVIRHVDPEHSWIPMRVAGAMLARGYRDRQVLETLGLSPADLAPSAGSLVPAMLNVRIGGPQYISLARKLDAYLRPALRATGRAPWLERSTFDVGSSPKIPEHLWPTLDRLDEGIRSRCGVSPGCVVEALRVHVAARYEGRHLLNELRAREVSTLSVVERNLLDQLQAQDVARERAMASLEEQEAKSHRVEWERIAEIDRIPNYVSYLDSQPPPEYLARAREALSKLENAERNMFSQISRTEGRLSAYHGVYRQSCAETSVFDINLNRSSQQVIWSEGSKMFIDFRRHLDPMQLEIIAEKGTRRVSVPGGRVEMEVFDVRNRDGSVTLIGVGGGYYTAVEEGADQASFILERCARL